jgi:hypothetical protein
MQQRRLSIPNIGEYSSISNNPSTNKTKTPTNEVIVGVLGSSTYYKEEDINQLTLTLIELWGKPSKILLEPKGTSSMFIDSWAERNKIEVVPIEAEWAKYGPRACIFVSSKIEKEATHIIIIRSPKAKSDKMLQKANTLAKSKDVIVVMGRDSETNGLLIDQYEQAVREGNPLQPPNTKSPKNKSMTLENWIVTRGKSPSTLKANKNA